MQSLFNLMNFSNRGVLNSSATQQLSGVGGWNLGWSGVGFWHFSIFYCIFSSIMGKYCIFVSFCFISRVWSGQNDSPLFSDIDSCNLQMWFMMVA